MGAREGRSAPEPLSCWLEVTTLLARWELWEERCRGRWGENY